MRFTPTVPPREFRVGKAVPITLRDCGRIELDPDEQVTFVTPSGSEYDVARKSWGFYATPSLNQRLPKLGFRSLLAKSPDGKVYVFLVERGRETEMEAYMKVEGHTVITWLDLEDALRRLEELLRGPSK